MRGSETYSVRLACSENRLGLACECPFFFDKGQHCKHIWAAILAADEQGYLSEATAAIEHTMPVIKPDSTASMEDAAKQDCDRNS